MIGRLNMLLPSFTTEHSQSREPHGRLHSPRNNADSSRERSQGLTKNLWFVAWNFLKKKKKVAKRVLKLFKSTCVHLFEMCVDVKRNTCFLDIVDLLVQSVLTVFDSCLLALIHCSLLNWLSLIYTLLSAHSCVVSVSFHSILLDKHHVTTNNFIVVTWRWHCAGLAELHFPVFLFRLPPWDSFSQSN